MVVGCFFWEDSTGMSNFNGECLPGNFKWVGVWRGGQKDLDRLKKNGGGIASDPLEWQVGCFGRQVYDFICGERVNAPV